MEKKYQVFLSSTYEDLKEERLEVMKALLGLGCIPCGMEYFPAASEEQWSYIEKLIASCDYYVVVVAGRYGSTDSTGLSFTEKEYDLANRLEIPTLAFIHSDPGSLRSDRVESYQKPKRRLERFREKLQEKKLCKKWVSKEELGSVVSNSLVHLMETQPRCGWIRADNPKPVLEGGYDYRQTASSSVGESAPTDRIEEIDDKENFIDYQVSAIEKAESAVALLLHTVSASNANWKAKAINSALVAAKERGVTVRVLAGSGASQISGAHELEEENGIDVYLNPELLHSELRFLKVDSEVVVLGVAERTSTLQEGYTPSRSWAFLKTLTLSNALEREFFRLWVSPATKDLYRTCLEYVHPLRKQYPAEKLAADIGFADPEFLRQFYNKLDLASVIGDRVFVFYGKACAGKTTLMKRLIRRLGGRRLDLLPFVLPFVFRYGNNSVIGDLVKDIYEDVLGHLAGVTEPYDFVEASAEFPDFLLPLLFKEIRAKGRTPVLIHCSVPLDEARRRNGLRSRAVPKGILERQHEDEESKVFLDICEDFGIYHFKIETKELIEDNLDAIEAEIKKRT